MLVNLYDFVTGGSIAAPVGLVLALLATHFGAGIAPLGTAGGFFAILVLTFFASTLERPR